MGLHDSGDDGDGCQGHLLSAPGHAALHHQHQLLPTLHASTNTAVTTVIETVVTTSLPHSLFIQIVLVLGPDFSLISVSEREQMIPGCRFDQHQFRFLDAIYSVSGNGMDSCLKQNI